MLVVAAALLDGSGRALMHCRPLDKHHGGLWEFPGGKVDENESPADALCRELHEELGIAVDPGDLDPLSFVAGPPPRGATAPIVILLYTCRRWTGAPHAIEGEGIAWCDRAGCEALDLAPLDRVLLAQPQSERLFHSFEK
ncbi:(deoxy)nucleoside triphosphate pyrophosphohydrolase [Croceicoccus sediminis]|uniref:(deoxy)nucleoside triphosphate pyrophosphohydrolase n=1 Tax=Croceicoccus sediminis TaxID=2571150 RepID=UPI0011831ACA|nr:(deoxy)nucleoside triphosphate pyrophosphohydrolase [Croceicoccus sediminis]